MKTLNAIEANHQVIEVMETFTKIATQYPESQPPRFEAIISNVSFVDFIILFKNMSKGIDTQKIQLYMPGELRSESMVIIYNPAPGFKITIHSEEVLKYKAPRVNTLNYN